MRRIYAILLCLLPLPAVAESDQDAGDLMSRGAQMLLEGLRQQLDPTLGDLQALAEQMGPAMRDLVTTMGPAFADILGQIDSFSDYDPPELLPNGDILLRKKPIEDAEPLPPLQPGETDL